MADAAVGQLAARLPWLAPARRSLLALTDEVPDAAVLARDPAAVLLALRFVRPTPQADDVRLDSSLFMHSVVPEAAARFLETDDSLPIPDDLAEYAERLADECDRAGGPVAAVVGLRAPLGRRAVAAVDPTATDTELTNDGIARRLARRWRLPAWVADVVGSLSQSDETVARFSGDVHLASVVRTAVRTTGDPFGLLGTPGSERVVGPTLRTPDPFDPLMPRLLRAVARERRAANTAAIERLERDLDAALGVLKAAEASADVRARDAKLSALAELAGGAGHEINNPLAVISGNAQLLLARESDADRRKALGSIVRQVRRISDIVADLMQFARPRPPHPRRFAVAAWLAGVVDAHRPLAGVKAVHLDYHPSADDQTWADADQLGKAVGELIRNAIEATPADGWVHVRCDGRTVVVEDSGPGPVAAAVDHLFDPFFSGRQAGRGRGLGLPTAWRLATQNGGDVRFVPQADGPTRFVLELPADRADAVPRSDRRTA